MARVSRLVWLALALAIACSSEDEAAPEADPCAGVTCAPVPYCGEACEAPCGCCGCTAGVAANTPRGRAICTGGCFVLLGDAALPEDAGGVDAAPDAGGGDGGEDAAARYSGL
jgi:hypothetical protein